MFANFDYTNFPIVKVTCNGDVIKKADYEHFKEQWIYIHSLNKKFTLVFDTRNIGMVNTVYCIRIANFVKDYRDEEEELLQKTIVIITSQYVRFVLRFLCTIEKPTKPIYITRKYHPTFISSLIEKIERKESIPRNITVMSP